MTCHTKSCSKPESYPTNARRVGSDPLNHPADEGASNALSKRTEAKNGDQIIQLGNEGRIMQYGVLHGATPETTTATATSYPSSASRCACMCDCLHVDDVAAMLKERASTSGPLASNPSPPAHAGGRIPQRR